MSASNMAATDTKLKATFFAELDRLNEDSDSDEKSEGAKRTHQSTPRATVTTSSIASSLARSQSDSVVNNYQTAPGMLDPADPPSSLQNPSSSTSTVDSRRLDPSRDETRPDLAKRRTVSNPSINSLVLKPSAGVMSMLGRKRKQSEPSKGRSATKRKTSLKRTDFIQLVPEQYRIFQDLNFFYVPNDDNSPLRRLRIMKAREHGAKWVTDKDILSGCVVTHVIVDKKIMYEDVVKYISRFSIKPEGIVMVNEDYPIRCCQMRLVLDPDQVHYQVPGSLSTKPGEKAQDLTKRNSQRSDVSLKIKQSNKQRDADIVKETPPQSHDSTQISGGRHSLHIPQNETESDKRLSTTEQLDARILVDCPPIESEATTTRASMHGTREKDALDEMITIAQRVRHLPLDSDDEERPSSRDEPEEIGDSGSDNAPARTRLSPKTSFKKLGSKSVFKQDNFTCMTGGSGAKGETSVNDDTIAILQEMSDFYDRCGDKWRPRAYRMAIGTLRKQPKRISSAEEAAQLPSIGERLAKKIEEIVLTSKLRRLDYARAEPTYQSLQLFMNIYGVSITHASLWVSRGYKSLEDLKEHVNLTPNQRIGIEHYDDLKTRIPRDEVTALGKSVEQAAQAIDPDVQVIIGGSYRRGAQISGDIDLLLTRPGTTSTSELLPFLLCLQRSLEEAQFLVWTLAAPHSSTGSKWHGCCVLPSASPPTWRRIDLLIVPATEVGAALIYFTGDDIFNRSMRLLAKKKGMRLNQRGLYNESLRGPERERASARPRSSEGNLVEGRDERAVFECLQVPWREPRERICH